MSLISLRNIDKTYGQGANQQRVLEDIQLEIQAGEFVAIMGSSGSGKSTLMNIIGLLDKPTTGEYQFDARNVANLSDDDLARLRNQAIGFVFQQFFLLPRWTAIENVALPLSYRKNPEKNSEQAAIAMLEKVGMSQRLHYTPNQLSGGQQQRVAIARALVGLPKVILADEPTGALDSKTGQEVMSLFHQLNREDKTTVIIVTHDASVAEQCQRVIRIRDGRIE